MEDCENCRPQLGQVVKVLRGRDSGQYAVIVGVISPKYVLLADGDKRKSDRPKKKNLLHVDLKDYVSEEIANRLHEQGRVTNAKLRYALHDFHLRRPPEEEKGE
ncbi:KOW domain-containing RNA-binding protein [Numidum massiliense]|uniref:KOW domain-containing RNA-binding protein n=1 Tax=Numidum massiliense TaxID=1522315 RepID=UPI0006D53056|nr:KOW domain-containing RNA-binding protein [Numidum massiliense]